MPGSHSWKCTSTHTNVVQRVGISPKILGFGVFLKGSHARASPLHMRGIPRGVIPHKAPLETLRGAGGERCQPGLEERAGPRAQQEIYGAVTAAPPAAQLGPAVPSAPPRHPEAGSGIYSSRNTWIFKHRALEGVALFLCCRSPTGRSQGRRGAPHPIFLNYHAKKTNKKPTRQNSPKPTQSNGTACPGGARQNLPCGTTCLWNSHSPSYEGETFIYSKMAFP